MNTVVRRPGDVLVGDNTDWVGICETVQRCDHTHTRTHGPVTPARTWQADHCPGLSMRPNGRTLRTQLKTRFSAPPRVGLVLGAGGTARAACYALNQLGVCRNFVCGVGGGRWVALTRSSANPPGGRRPGWRCQVHDLIIHNRTMEKAQRLALDFNGMALGHADDPVWFGRFSHGPKAGLVCWAALARVARWPRVDLQAVGDARARGCDCEHHPCGGTARDVPARPVPPPAGRAGRRVPASAHRPAAPSSRPGLPDRARSAMLLLVWRHFNVARLTFGPPLFFMGCWLGAATQASTC